MKKIYYIIYVFLGILSLQNNTYGQQRPIISQYMFNGLLINPAFAGSHHQISATSLYRNQWVNLDGAPKLTTFSVHSALDDRRVGVGFISYLDQIGVHDDLGIYAMYSYRIKLPNSATLSMGLQGGFNQRWSNWEKLQLRDRSDRLLSGSSSSFNPNFGTGLYYYTNTLYLGVSVPYILNNRYISEEGNVFPQGKEKRYYFLNGGTIFDLSDGIKFKPSTLLRIQEGAPISFDINGSFIFQDVVSLGTSFRSGDALILLFEMKINNHLRFGYAYDMIISALRHHSGGTHEFMLNYRFNLTGVSSRIPCPSFLN
jgi:type IX secretion system PorP/SprF family membrane protein